MDAALTASALIDPLTNWLINSFGMAGGAGPAASTFFLRGRHRAPSRHTMSHTKFLTGSAVLRKCKRFGRCRLRSFDARSTSWQPQDSSIREEFGLRDFVVRRLLAGQRQ